MEINIEIYLHDLTPKKQTEILRLMGNNGNYDIYPIAVIHVNEDEQKS